MDIDYHIPQEAEETDHLDNTDLEYQKQEYSDDLDDCIALFSWNEASRLRTTNDPCVFFEVLIDSTRKNSNTSSAN